MKNLIIQNHEIHNEGGKYLINWVNRPNSNDCWNVALALGCNEDYDKVRNTVKNNILKDGKLLNYFIFKYLKNNGYEKMRSHCKTLQTFLDDTQYSNYEYVISISGHIAYARYGIIYDTFFKKGRRIKSVWRRKISKRRKEIHNYITKEEMKLSKHNQ